MHPFYRFVTVSLLALTVASVMAAATVARAQDLVLRPPGSKWQLNVPSGWEIGPAEALEAANSQAGASGTTESGARFVAVLFPSEDNGVYCMVQQLPPPPQGGKSEEVGNMFLDRDAAAEGISRSLPPGDKLLEVTPSFEPARCRATVDTVTESAEGRERGRSFINVGKSEMVALHFYAPDKGFAEMAPTLNAMADTFKWDPGAEYTYGSGGLGKASGLSIWRGIRVVLVLGVFVVGAIIALRAKLQKRGQVAPTAKPD